MACTQLYAMLGKPPLHPLHVVSHDTSSCLERELVLAKGSRPRRIESDSICAVAEKVQHEPHEPWSSTGVV